MVGEGQERDEKEGLGGKEKGEMAVRMWIIIIIKIIIITIKRN